MDDDSPTPTTQSARRRQIERRLKRARRNLTTAITERSAAISDAHEAGISLRDIATHVGISYSGVDKIPGSAVDGHMRGVRRAKMLVDGLRVV